MRRLGSLLRSSGTGGRLVRGSGVAFLTSTAGLVVSYLTNIYLTRLLGAAEFGLYGIALSWAALLLVPASLGHDRFVMRMLPTYRAERRWDLFRGVLRQSWWFTVLAGAVIGAIGAVVARFVSPSAALLLGFALVLPMGIMNLQSSLLRVQNRIFLAVAPNNLLRFVLLVAAVYLLVRLGLPASASTVLLALLGVVVAMVAVQGWVLQRNWRPEVLSTAPGYRTREWLAISLPLLLSSSALVLLKRTDVIMLGMLAPPAEVGIYFAAARVAALAAFAQTAVNAIASPLVSSVYAGGDRKRLQRLATGIVQLSFWPSLLGALLLIGFAEPILGLFGPEFVGARWPLTLLVIGYLMNSGAGAVGILLNMTGHQNATARVFTVAVVVNIALNLLTIPRFGIVGAAFSTALTMASWNVWLSVMVRRRLGLHTSVLGPLLRLFDRRG